MIDRLKLYIDGAWVDPTEPKFLDVVSPATEEVFAQVAVGSKADVDRAVLAARAAFRTFSQTSKTERLNLLRRILEVYNEKSEDLAKAVSEEMGAPITLARQMQTKVGQGHLESTIAALESFEFEEQRGSTRVVREAIGVVALITPWNWPLNQIVCKVAPAIAAGCTILLKPSEISPLSGLVFADIMDEAGVPRGVFNLINGDGPTVGQVMAAHADIDMVSFTGSTRAGVIVAKTAADTVKRVAQELGGKSPNIIMRDADLESAVTKGVQACFANSGQSCNAPTRMLVPRESHARALEIAKKTAENHRVGEPKFVETDLGPVASRAQFEKIQRLISSGIEEGATLVTGGTGRPEGLDRGYYVRPTVFGNVSPDMTVSREEIFGPVLTITPYDTDEDAVEIANDTPYGLAAYVQSKDTESARKVARGLRAGQIRINYPPLDRFAPFGGYKQSGNGREYADWGIHEFLEIKGIVGYGT